MVPKLHKTLILMIQPKKQCIKSYSNKTMFIEEYLFYQQHNYTGQWTYLFPWEDWVANQGNCISQNPFETLCISVRSCHNHLFFHQLLTTSLSAAMTYLRVEQQT